MTITAVVLGTVAAIGAMIAFAVFGSPFIEWAHRRPIASTLTILAFAILVAAALETPH